MSNETNGTNGTNETILDIHGSEEVHDSTVILFLFGTCAVGALTRRVIQGLKLRLPYTVVLLVLGFLFGLLSREFDNVHEYAKVVDADPHLILSIFLPVLLFESAFAMEVHTFIKAFIQVVLLAIPGLAIASFMTCILARYLFTYGWDWNVGMMFGAILSATDPVAVVALLRDVGASKELATVIEGEALLNDGAAIVFFNIFLKLATSEVGLTGGDIVVYFLQVAIGGPFFGFIFAKITLYCLARIFNDALAEITVTLASTYITYYVVEEFLQMSGVLAVVVLGITMSSERTNISPEVERFLHKFWETLAYLANTLIFVIVGIVIAEQAIFEIHGIDWFYMFSVYFGIFVIRGMVIGMFSPLMQRTGYGMSWKEGVIMTWGGLRGAVGLALALQVAHHAKIDQQTIGVRVLVHVSGVVALTLLVNATTIMWLLKTLGMSDLSQAKRMAMSNSLRHLQELREKTLNMLKTDRFLADAEWETVEKQTEVVDPYETNEDEEEVDEPLDIKAQAHCPDCDFTLPPQYSRKELRDMTNEAILMMLKAEKMSYWRQFEQGMLSREATRKLQECTEIAADKKGKFVDIEDIKKSWEIPNFYPKCKAIIKRTITKTDINFEKGDPLQVIHTVTRHPVFYIAIFIIIVFDMFNAGFAIAKQFSDNFFGTKSLFRIINVFPFMIYTIEALLKFKVQRKLYFKSVWHILCIVIISIGALDVLLGFLLTLISDDTHSNHIVAVVFILLRTIRIFRLLEPVMPYVLLFIKHRMNKHLSYGFDVGRGFVAGEEEVRKFIDHMVDHKDIAKTMKQMCDNGRLDVIRCLGMQSKQHPDIALSIKTRQAIRSVLNQIRDGITELTMDGILEEAEGHKLEKVVEEKMKRQQNAPPSLPIPPPDKMLSNVSWLRNDPELMAYIKEKVTLLNFDYDDVVMEEGDPPGGVFIIVSGMVRLESTNPPAKHLFNMQEKPSGSHLQIKSYLLDFMTAGNIIGEMGLLTQKPRSATVICETAVQALFVSMEDMQHALDNTIGEQEPLTYRLWHVCANRIAANILTKQSSFQGWTKEKIKLRLENSYIADCEDSTFCVDSTMTDVVLCHGVAKNPFTDEMFEGPCYIPWTVFKLDLLPHEGSRPVVILVVPSEAGHPGHSHGQKTKDERRGHGAFVNTVSQLCLRHSAQQRDNVNSKWKKVQNAKSVGTLFKTSAHDGHPMTFPNGMPTSGTGLHQRASNPAPFHGRENESFTPDDHHNEHGHTASIEDLRIDIGMRRALSLSSAHSTDKLPKRGSSWAKLKNILKPKHDDHDPNRRRLSSDVLPDDVEYIEGGDLVHSVDHTDQIPSSPVLSMHSLDPVFEENDTELGDSNNATTRNVVGTSAGVNDRTEVGSVTKSHTTHTPDDHHNEHGHTASIEDLRIDIGMRRALSLSSAHSTDTLPKRGSSWAKLKNILKPKHDDHDPNRRRLSSDVLPDDVKYIEGGDLVHSVDHTDQIPSSPVLSMHSLDPVFEENDTELGDSNNATTRNVVGTSAGVNDRTEVGSVTKSHTTHGVLKPGIDDTKL